MSDTDKPIEIDPCEPCLLCGKFGEGCYCGECREMVREKVRDCFEQVALREKLQEAVERALRETRKQVPALEEMLRRIKSINEMVERGKDKDNEQKYHQD